LNVADSTTAGYTPAERRGQGNGANIKSLRAAIRILDALAAAGEPVRITELAHLLGETKAKVHRYLATLRDLGIVEQARASERYRLGWKLYQLGQAALEQFDLKRIAEPHMTMLRDLMRQTVVLSIPIGGEALVISNIEHTGTAIKIAGVTGSIAPSNASAQGRVMLAYASRPQQQKILNGPLAKLSPYSMTDRHEIETRLALIRKRLYETAASETVVGINTIAAPIFDRDSKVIGTVGILGSVHFIPDPPDAEQVSAVQACAAAISAEFGSDAYRGIARPLSPAHEARAVRTKSRKAR
jgi:IclR family transcriptional regulator, KDG regulon repressor